MYWSEGFWPHCGGVERFSMQLMRALQPQGYEFLVITSSYKDSLEEELHEGIRVVRLPMRQGLARQLHAYKKTIEKIIELKNQFKPNLYHLNTTGPSFYYHLKTRLISQAPTVFTLHYLIPKTMNEKGLLGEMFQHSDWITGGSQATLAHLHGVFPTLVERSSLIYHGLPKPNVQPMPLDKNSTYLFSFGRLVMNKGFGLMIEAFSHLAKKYPGLQYWIAGQGPDDARLQQLIGQHHLQDKVRLLGFVNDEQLFELINRARMIVLPSHDWSECFGLAALESMQMAKPVVTTRHSGLNEVVLENETALLFEPNNIASLVCCVERLLEDFDLAHTLGINGQNRAEKLFSMEQMSSGYDRLFKQLLEKNDECKN